jgi:hypothetical protein
MRLSAPEDGGEDTRRRLVVSGGDGAEPLECVEAAVDAVPERVECPIEAELVVRVGGVGRDDGLHSTRPDAVDDRLGGVTGIADARLARAWSMSSKAFTASCRWPCVSVT